jgi:hypothetical protein
MNVGVMKDYKLRDLRTSHTLGWSWYWEKLSHPLYLEVLVKARSLFFFIWRIFFPPENSTLC